MCECQQYSGVSMRKQARYELKIDYSLCRSDSECGFASFGPAEYSGGRVTNQNLQVGYISGEFATGTVGREDVTFAGLTVRNQHLGLAERAFFTNQNGLASGIMGEFGLS